MQFNLRVYGVLINDQGQVLVADEIIKGKYYTKFPGGGLEFGEGTIDCLKREFLEEMNLKVEVQEHIYTTDYFQLSAFHPDHQIISIYYKVAHLEEISARLNTTSFNFEKNETECFRFIEWEELTEESVSLPIDKIVVSLVKDRF